MKTVTRDGAMSPEADAPFGELFVWLSYLPCCGLGLFPAGIDHAMAETDLEDRADDSLH